MLAVTTYCRALDVEQARNTFDWRVTAVAKNEVAAVEDS